jgi:1,4-dihydroxy-2-naphthoyl-CoA hydrolase
MSAPPSPEAALFKDAEYFNRLGADLFPGRVGVEALSIDDTKVTCKLTIRPDHLTVNGMLHGAVMVVLADTACGYGTIALLPKGAKGHATIDLSCNLLRTATEGSIHCDAVPMHLGRSTHVWDSRIIHKETGRTLALFRCTQMILW